MLLELKDDGENYTIENNPGWETTKYSKLNAEKTKELVLKSNGNEETIKCLVCDKMAKLHDR